MRRSATAASLCLLITTAAPDTSAQPPEVDGCPVFPGDNIWNVPVDTLPVDPASDVYVETIGAGSGVHPDFGTVYMGAPNGIPFVTVPGSQTPVAVTFFWDDESDPGPYPIPGDARSKGARRATATVTCW